VGINGTRAMTAFNSKSGGFFKTTVGRVQTPTLAIVVERNKRLKIRLARLLGIIGTFDAAAGQYTGRWIDESFPGAMAGRRPDLKPERYGIRPRLRPSGIMPRQNRHRHRGKQAYHVHLAVTL